MKHTAAAHGEMNSGTVLKIVMETPQLVRHCVAPCKLGCIVLVLDTNSIMAA
jgi:TusA-related sulfurtransferase